MFCFLYMSNLYFKSSNFFLNVFLNIKILDYSFSKLYGKLLFLTLFRLRMRVDMCVCTYVRKYVCECMYA